MTTVATLIATRGAGRRVCAPRLFAAALLAFLPAAASACAPLPHEGDAPVVQPGERGAQLWLYDGVLESRLAPADDLGGGFVVQTASAGNGCANEISTVLQDCNTGEAIAFGGDSDPEDPAQWTLQRALLDDIRAGIDRGEPWPMARIGAEAAARGLDFAVPMRTTSRLLLGAMEVRLGGGCRAFYPRLPGAQG